MQRKDFLKLGSLGLLGSSFTTLDARKPKKTIRPRALQEGDTVALLAPASQTSPENFEKAKTNLQSLGLTVKVMPNAAAETGFLAGTDSQRLADLHQAFSDEEIKAVWCLRGGYGTPRLLPNLNMNLIRKNPKIFIGYSDITALLNAIQKCTGLVTFHGPMGTSDFNDFSKNSLKNVLFEGKSSVFIKNKGTLPKDGTFTSPDPISLKNGRATGELVGGNLTLLASLCGTSFQPCFKGKIVLMEDIGEQPYRIDRMLTQLLQATDLRRAAGIALGIFEDCKPKGSSPSFSLLEVLQERLGQLNIPTFYGLPFGHISEQVTLPIGVRATLDADAGTLRLEEAAVL